MEIKKLKLDELSVVETYNLSFPLKPELYNHLREAFAHLPLIFINDTGEIVFGVDYYRYLHSKGETYADVIQADVSEKEALFLSFNLKERLTGVNLYEKLVFVKRIIPMAEPPEIYRKTDLDITINRELVEKLDLLVSVDFRMNLVEESIGLKTALKLCDFNSEDREDILELFSRIPFSSSFQLRLVEMAEEILFRDKCSLTDVFNTLGIENYMEREKPQKQIVDAFFKHRNPIYLERESQWENELKGLGLPDNIKVTHYPFFEKKDMEVTISLKDAGELKHLIEKIKGSPVAGGEAVD